MNEATILQIGQSRDGRRYYCGACRDHGDGESS